jgi:archaellin
MKEVILASVLPSKDYEIQAVLIFWNEEKFEEFLKAENKRHWLKEELGRSEEYFWNTAIFLNEKEYKEWVGADDYDDLENKYKNAEYINIE